MKNDEIADMCVDCNKCPHQHKNDFYKFKQNCINCSNFVEKALEIKDTNIKSAINKVVSHYNKEAENDNVSITAKHMYLLGAEYVSQAMSMLKQELSLKD